MKLLWFHLMPYTELPEDFRQKHPSVWVDIHSSLFDPKRAHLMYNDFMDEMEVYIKQSWLTWLVVHHVRVPDLLKHCLWGHVYL